MSASKESTAHAESFWFGFDEMPNDATHADEVEFLAEWRDRAIAGERERSGPLIAMLQEWITADDWADHLSSMEDLMNRSKAAIEEYIR